MIPAIFHISLDIDDAFSQASMNLCQGESGRLAAISLSQSGRAFPVGDDCRAVCAGTRPDGTVFFIDCSIENGLIFCELSALHTASPGTVRAEIRVYGSGDVLIASPAFNLEIRESAMEDGPIVQGDQATALTKLMSQAMETMDNMELSRIVAAEVSMDTQVGEPSAAVELIPGEDGQTIKLILSNMKGEKGDKGEAGDSPVVIEGKMTKEDPSGYGSFSLNRKADTAIGKYSVAIGHDSTASGDYSYAEGRNTLASAIYAHAEGNGCIVNGAASHAEGWYTQCKAGHASHAEGEECQTWAKNSHAEGYSSIARGAEQHVQGRSNIEDMEGKYAHIVGNGADKNNRSNAHTLDWGGNAWFAGKVFIGGTGADDPDAVELGSGGYVIRVPASDISYDEGSGNTDIILTESYDNFAPAAARGGSLWLDLTKSPVYEGAGIGLVMAPVMGVLYAPAMGGVVLIGLDALMGGMVMVTCPNGTWRPEGAAEESAE